MDHPTHKLDAYKDGYFWTPFCKVCSREGDLLSKPCPGSIQKSDIVGISTVDKDTERK